MIIFVVTLWHTLPTSIKPTTYSSITKRPAIIDAATTITIPTASPFCPWITAAVEDGAGANRAVEDKAGADKVDNHKHPMPIRVKIIATPCLTPTQLCPIIIT